MQLLILIPIPYTNKVEKLYHIGSLESIVPNPTSCYHIKGHDFRVTVVVRCVGMYAI